MNLALVNPHWQREELPVPVQPNHLCLARGAVRVYTGIEQETIHCSSGQLWVTFADDPTDYVVQAGEYLEVPNAGKVLVSGPGCFHISRGIDELEAEAC